MCQSCTQFPEEWLDKEAYGFFSTNRDILHDPQEKEFALLRTDWFNPYAEPEKLEKQRQASGKTGLEWQKYVEENYPGIDAKKQRELCIEENNAKRMNRCGEIRYRRNKYNPKKTDKRIWYCKVKGCPVCNARKKRGIIKRLTENRNNVILYEIDDKKASQIKKNRKKHNYEQYNCEKTGKVYMLLAISDPVEGLEGNRLTKDKIEEISQATVACEKKRQSGKLLNLKEKEKEEEEKEEEKVNLKRRVYTIDFSESDLETHDQLDELVVEKYEPVGETMDLDVLQYSTYVLEELTFKIAREHCAKIHFRGVESVSLYLSKVDWWEFIKNPFDV